MHATGNAKEMGGLRANSNADATVPAKEKFLKPVNQEDEAHPDPALSQHPIFDRVLPSLGEDILEEAKEMIQEQQDDGDDQIVTDDDEKGDTTPSDENEAPIIMPPPPKADPEEGMITTKPIKEAEPFSNKAKGAIEEVVGAEESHPGIIHVPQMSEGKDEAQKEDIGKEDQFDFEFDGNSVKEEDEVEENVAVNDDNDCNVGEQSADDAAEIAAPEKNDDVDDGTADDDAVDDTNDDDRVPIPEDKPVVESVSLKKRKPNDETREPYLPDDSNTAPCGASSSISTALRCKTSALIRYHTVGLMLGASLILAFFCYRRKRRLGGRRSRRLDKSHEYARIIQEYDDLEGTFDDDISYNYDNETMSTWSDGGVGGLEMLGVHELNG